MALTAAPGQVERGANRIYGVQRDRLSARKYAHAFLMAVGAGIPAMAGVVLLVAVNAFADAVEPRTVSTKTWCRPSAYRPVSC